MNYMVKSQTYCGTFNACDFVYGTVSHAKSSLHWSVIHYQMTFEEHFGNGLELSMDYDQLRTSQSWFICGNL